MRELTNEQIEQVAGAGGSYNAPDPYAPPPAYGPTPYGQYTPDPYSHNTHNKHHKHHNHKHHHHHS